jgi:hypothetical protein
MIFVTLFCIDKFHIPWVIKWTQNKLKWNSWAGRPRSCLAFYYESPSPLLTESILKLWWYRGRTKHTEHNIKFWNFVFKMPRPALGPTQPSIQQVLDFSTGATATGREVVHSSPFSAELMNEWSYTSAPLYDFMAWRGTILPLSVSYVSFFGKMCWRNYTGAVN